MTTDIHNDESLNEHETPSAYLKRLRLKKDLTQRQLGKYLDVNQATIMRWEKGVTPISGDIAEKLADFFQVPLVGFYKGENPTSKTSTFDELIFKFKAFDESTGSLMTQSSLKDFVLPVATNDFYCVKVASDAMTSSNPNRSIPKGAIAFIAPAKSMERWENHVVYGTFDGKHYFIRELSSDRGEYFLRPWNTLYKPDYDLSNFKMSGCVLGVFVPF